MTGGRYGGGIGVVDTRGWEGAPCCCWPGPRCCWPGPRRAGGGIEVVDTRECCCGCWVRRLGTALGPAAALARAGPEGALLFDAFASLRARLGFLPATWSAFWAGGGPRTATAAPLGLALSALPAWRAAFLLAGSWWASGSGSAAAACVSWLPWMGPACFPASRGCGSAREWKET